MCVFLYAGEYIAVIANPNKIKQVTCFLDESVFQANENLHPVLEKFLKDLLEWPEGSVQIHIEQFAGEHCK